MKANNVKGSGVIQRCEYIPLDFIKTEVIGLSTDHFTGNRHLLFTTHLKDRDTVVFDWCEIDNIKLKIYPSGRIELSGSLHKYSNNGEHNYNDFDFYAFRNVLTRLYSDFGVMPKNLRIIQLEYGLNLTPDIKTETILRGLFQHKTVTFDRFSNRHGTYYQAEHSQYFLKVYNKGKQYKLDRECMRIEIKQRNWTNYRKQGICTLQDFIETDKTIFIKYLTDRWDEVVFYDLTDKHLSKWGKYSNELYWRNLRKKNTNKTFSVHLKKLRELNNQYGNNTQLKVTEMIYSKLDELQGVTNFNVNKEERLCKVTGLDISMQRTDSFLLSHKGLFNLYSTNQAEFDRLKRLFLTYRWFNRPLQEQVKEMAHSIRSRFNYRMKRTDKNQLKLFTSSGNVFQVHI
jgi:hypothetical protein